jgi:predicted PurR-regulated permease PerM
MSETNTTDPRRSEHLVPVWLENLAALGWRVLVIAAFALMLWYLTTLIWNVILAIGLAVVVAVILAPIVLRLREQGRSRAAAASITWVATIGAFLGLILVLGLALLPYLVELADRLQAGQADLDSIRSELALPSWLTDLVRQVVSSSADIADGALGSLVGSLANLVGIVVIGAFLLFFFLKDGDKAWLWLFQSMPEEKREIITTAGDDALRRVSAYVRANTVTAAVGAATSLFFMLLLGTPLAVPLAVLAFVLGFVPYFGNAIAIVLIVLVTLGAVGPGAAGAMFVLLVARVVAVHWFVEPRVFAAADRLHPVIIIIVLPIGYHLGGIVGLVLAVPLAAFGRSVVDAMIEILRPATPPNLPEIVPAWLDRAAQWSWRGVIAIAFLAVLVIVLLTFPLVVMPVILALIFAATVLPLVDLLIGRGQPRGLAAALAVGGSTVVVAAVVALSLVSLVHQAPELGRTAMAGADSANEAASGQLGLGSDAISSGVQAGVGMLDGLADDLVSLVVVLLLAVLLTFYFLRDGAGLWRELMSHLPSDPAAEISEAGVRAFGVLGGYMIGTGAISFVGAASQLVIMWLLGLPLLLPIFVLSFFGGFIPYIGSILTTGLAFLVTLAVGSPFDILVMAVWTGVFNIVQGNVVAPLVYNRTTDIHPAVVLAAIPAGAAVAGILGMFLVVPALGVVSATWRSVLRIMGATPDEIPGPRVEEVEPVPPPPAAPASPDPLPRPGT